MGKMHMLQEETNDEQLQRLEQDQLHTTSQPRQGSGTRGSSAHSEGYECTQPNSLHGHKKGQDVARATRNKQEKEIG